MGWGQSIFLSRGDLSQFAREGHCVPGEGEPKGLNETFDGVKLSRKWIATFSIGFPDIQWAPPTGEALKKQNKNKS